MLQTISAFSVIKKLYELHHIESYLHGATVILGIVTTSHAGHIRNSEKLQDTTQLHCTDSPLQPKAKSLLEEVQINITFTVVSTHRRRLNSVKNSYGHRLRRFNSMEMLYISQRVSNKICIDNSGYHACSFGSQQLPGIKTEHEYIKNALDEVLC